MYYFTVIRLNFDFNLFQLVQVRLTYPKNLKESQKISKNLKESQRIPRNAADLFSVWCRFADLTSDVL